jgi:hypothetical protein
MKKTRLDHEPPEAIEKWGWRYHHTGIPTSDTIPGGQYLPQFDLYVSGFETSPFGIEWMKYGENSPIDILIKRIPHIAFEVDDLDHELENHNFNIITEPNSPGKGTRVAMIEHNGAPVELIEFEKSKQERKARLSLAVMPERLAVCSLGKDEMVPSWAIRSTFFSITRSDDELSVVCPECNVPEDVRSEKSWRALKVVGSLDFALTGIMSSMTKPLADANISIFAISTFNTDYILVKDENLEKALQILEKYFNYAPANQDIDSITLSEPLSSCPG